MSSSHPRIVLITSAGCPACTAFLAGPWRTLKDRLNGGVGVEHIDVVRDGRDKVPVEIRPKLQFVPQLFAIYDDGFVESPKNPIGSPAGVKELEDWVKKGPPRYAATPSTVEGDSGADSELEVVVVTSTTCPRCLEWESSGGLERFLASIPAGVRRSHYDVPRTPPSSPEDSLRRMALNGINVPSVIIVNHAEWNRPAASTPPKILMSPFEVRIPEAAANFRRWLKLLTEDDKKPFLGYLLLSTSSSCGHCIRWKESGGMDKFVESYKNLPGIVLSHNGYMPERIRSQIRSFPSVFFVPASEWGSMNPEIIPGPNPQDETATASWIAQISSDEGRWTNDPQFVPPKFKPQTARGLSRAAVAKRPVVRQRFRQ